MSESKGRAGRLRAVAIGVLIAGAALAYAVGVAGPTLVAAAILYGAAEIVAGLRRSARTRSSDCGSHDAVASA